ncbi:hypothetical protein D9758_008523 [Tetrapyrgos nigripes]|uniref:Carbonic anhydrase n=1 Tax=Tetrapyrgos nigripes TaxID=182062 RepID=A0A8H5G5R7_9AGAR|nr:hypothetical protein D9758_008523 [Tetrapyrgos nigripes]
MPSTYANSPSIPSEELLQRNAKYAETHVAKLGKQHWEEFPKNAIITCMDDRLNLQNQLGLADNDTITIRNGGGRVAEVLTTILIAQKFGSRHFMLIKHTDCGGFYISRDILVKHFKNTNTKNPNAIDDFLPNQIGFGEKTVEEAVLGDVQFLRDSPLIFEETEVSGWVLDDSTGKIRQIA